MAKAKTSAKSSTTKKATRKTTTKVKEVTTAQAVIKNLKKPAKTPIYLKEGVTGKMMMQALSKANKSIKAERSSFSRCLKDAFEHGHKTGAFKNIKGFNEKDCTPRKLIRYRYNHRKEVQTFNTWEVLNMIKDMYKAKNGK